tara:strand:+ start:8978 stop:9259 length:282 start_codon:yes stop_codon:yes gene_type:complete
MALLAMSQKGNPTAELIDEMAPRTIGRILSLVASDSSRKVRLPKHLRSRLDLMCQFRHPAALMLRDWLDGKRQLLPANFKTIADYSCSSEEAK